MPVDIGDILNPTKEYPIVPCRISLMKMFCYGKVLNIGCFEGKMFSDKATNLDIIDNGAPNLVIANASKLPFDDKSFDTAVLSEVLEHVDDPAAVLREAMRVADSIAISVPNESEFSASQKPFTCKEHVRFFDQQSFTDLLMEVGLPLIYFSKVTMGGWSELIAFGSNIMTIPLQHRIGSTKLDTRNGFAVGLTVCETIALLPQGTELVSMGTTPGGDPWYKVHEKNYDYED